MAGQNIGNLKVSIGADTEDLARGIGRARALMGSLTGAAKVAGVAAGASFAAASVGLVSLTKGGLEAVDAQAKMARSVDGTIDGLRALQIAGGYAGASLEDVNNAVQQMGKRLAEAARDGTGPAADALKTLGLDARALIELDIDARIGAIADRINEMGLGAQEASGLMRDLGVRSSEMSLVLLQGSGAIRAARDEVRKFGISLSADAAAGVEAANDALSKIGFVFESLRNQLAVSLAPLLEKLAVDFQNASQSGEPLQAAVMALVGAFSELATAILNPAFVEAVTLFGSTLARAIANVAEFTVTLAENAEIAGAAMIALGAAMAFFSGPIGLAIAAVASGTFLLSTALGDSSTAADGVETAYLDLVAALDGIDRANSDAVASGRELIESHITQARAAVEAARAEYELRRAEATRAVDQAKMRKENLPGNFFGDDEIGQAGEDLELVDQYYSDLIAKREAQLVEYQKVLEGFQRSSFPTQGTRPASGEAAPDGASDPASVTEKFRKELDALIDRLDPAAAKTKAMARDHATLAAALIKGEITLEEYNRRMDQLKGLYAELPDATTAAAAGLSKVNKELGKNPAASLADDVNGAIGNVINTIENGSDALRNFGIELIKIFAVRGISKILGGSNWLTGDLFIPGNALGTDNWRGGLSWVGERGPELVNLPMGAQVIPNNKIGQLGGGGMQFTYAPKIDARGASLAAVQELENRLAADAAQFNAKVEQAVMKAKAGRKL